MSSDIDLIDKESFTEEVENIEEEPSLDEIDEKGAKKRNTRHHLKVRRAIEEHLEKKRFRQEIDYLDDE